MNKEELYIDGYLKKFMENYKEPSPEEIIKKSVIAQCRYMDKGDIYEWIALDEVERYKQKEEIERLNKERKAIKKYVHNHTITYIDNGIECCKPDEYFNISWVENMLCGNFENLETLFEGEDKE